MAQSPEGAMKMLSSIGSSRSAAVTVYAPEDLVPTTNGRLPGFEAHTETGMALAWDAAAKNLLFKVLLFGWPGTGKTLFPVHLAHSLRRAGLDYYLLEMNCAKLVTCLNEDEALRDFSAADAAIASEQFRPLIIAFDGIEV